VICIVGWVLGMTHGLKKALRVAGQAMLVAAVVIGLSACGQENPQFQLANTDSASMMTSFENGQASMSCGLSCSMSYGSKRRLLKTVYEEGEWEDLAQVVLQIGYNNDQSWFYLASAAMGLGYDDAAEIYFDNAMSAGTTKCQGLIDVCDGIDVQYLAAANESALVAKHNKRVFAQKTQPAPAVDNTASTPASTAPDQNDTNTQDTTSTVPQESDGESENDVRLVDDGSTFEVPVLINGVLPLNFLIDSGASDVSIPADVALTLVRTGTLQPTDFIGTQTYTLADGSTVPSPTFVIRSLKVGDQVIRNVKATITNVNGDLLLGESFLRRFNSWSIDNSRQVLVLK